MSFPIVGSSGDAPGETFADSFARINGMLGLAAVRTYSGGSIGTWMAGNVGTVMATTSNMVIVHSFKTWNETEIAAWLDTKPDDGRQVWIAYFHEPEDDTGTLPAATWRSRQQTMRTLIDQAGRSDVRLCSILMRWTLNPASGRDWHDWWVEDTFDAQFWDSYNTGYQNGNYADVEPIIQAMVDVATETGLPWGIAEHGSGTVPTDTDGSGRTAWLADYFTTATAAGMQMMLYWNRTSLSGDIHYELETHQSSVDLYAGYCEQSRIANNIESEESAMAWSPDGLNARADATAALVTHISLHNGDPSTTGANEVTGGGYARIAPSYGSASGGVVDITAPLEFSTPSEEPVSHIGMWASSTFLSGWARTSGDAAANAAGEYNVAAAPITAS